MNFDIDFIFFRCAESRMWNWLTVISMFVSIIEVAFYANLQIPSGGALSMSSSSKRLIVLFTNFVSITIWVHNSTGMSSTEKFKPSIDVGSTKQKTFLL